MTTRTLIREIFLGLLEFHANPPVAMTASRAKGYNMGLVAILEKPSDLQVYATHPAHLE